MNMLQKGLLAPGDNAERTEKKKKKKSSHRMAFVLVGTMLLGGQGRKPKAGWGKLLKMWDAESERKQCVCAAPVRTHAHVSLCCI